MHRILIRMAILAWMVTLVPGVLRAQHHTLIVLYERDHTPCSDAEITVYRALDRLVTQTKIVSKGVRVSRSKGKYDVGVLPDTDVLWVKIDSIREMVDIRRVNGKWPSEQEVTKPEKVAIASPTLPGSLRYLLVLRGFSECPAKGGVCHRALWQWVPEAAIAKLQGPIQTRYVAKPCHSCYHSDPDADGAP
jgi:hypothetical protein